VRLIKEALQILRDNRRLYLAVNLTYYGLVVVGAIVVWLNPQLQTSLITMVQEGFETSLPGVVAAYRSGNFLSAVAQTFTINFFLGSLIVLTLSACVFPPAGIMIGFWRAFLWGLVLAPTTPQLALAMIPHGITLLLEGQGYILAVFAACRLGQSPWCGPRASARPAAGGPTWPACERRPSFTSWSPSSSWSPPSGRPLN